MSCPPVRVKRELIRVGTASDAVICRAVAEPSWVVRAASRKNATFIVSWFSATPSLEINWDQTKTPSASMVPEPWS